MYQMAEAARWGWGKALREAGRPGSVPGGPRLGGPGGSRGREPRRNRAPWEHRLVCLASREGSQKPNKRGRGVGYLGDQQEVSPQRLSFWN